MKDKISEHITYLEATRSRTAQRYGIPNDPDARQLKVMKHLAVNFFEPMRFNWGVPLFLSSFFRSQKLNTKIPGAAKRSDHMILDDVAAIDIDQDVFNWYGVTNNDIFWSVFECHRYYKLIAEFPVDGRLSWVHVSYSTDEAKNDEKRTMIATRINGRLKYLPFEGNEILVN